jgi:6-phosphogluconate dehydrogenase (decarboxylating)
MMATTIGIIGSGAMGAGIAQSCLASGLRVILYDSNAAALSKAKQEVFGRLARLVLLRLVVVLTAIIRVWLKSCRRCLIGIGGRRMHIGLHSSITAVVYLSA